LAEAEASRAKLHQPEVVKAKFARPTRNWLAASQCLARQCSAGDAGLAQTIGRARRQLRAKFAEAQEARKRLELAAEGH